MEEDNKMAITNAIVKAGSKALSKSAEKSLVKGVEKSVGSAVSDAVGKAVAKGLTGAGISTLAKGAGSTLDGVLGRSSGLTLPEPKVTTISLAENLNKAYPDEYVDGVGGLMQKMDTSLDDLYKNKKLSKDSYETLRKAGREGANFINDVESANAIGVSSKSNLPMLNRDQYYYDTLGSMRNPDGSLNKYVSSADVPSYMQSHLSNTTKESNDSILRELFGDNDSDLSDLYEKYEKIADGGNANEIYTPENINMGVMIGNGDADEAIQDLSDRVFRGKRDINVTGSSSGAKNIKVGRPIADMGVEEAVAEPATSAINPALADDIAELKAQLGSSGAGGAGGGTPTATASPDYGGLGDSGFKVKLKDGGTTNIKVGPEAVGSTKQQRAFRKLDDMTAKSMNPKDKQYAKLVGKSKSIDNHYKTVAERMRAEKIDQANVADKAGSALKLREDIKRQGLDYAEANGVTIDLSGIDNTVGLSNAQKKKLAELGLSLDDMLGGNRVVTPNQAEDIYKQLREYAWKWEGSDDPITDQAGKAMSKQAEAVRDIIDNTMDSINVDYKTSLLEEAAKNGEDPAYLRKIAGKKDFKFSDLRKDQSDWITIEDLAKNKIKEEPTINIFGTDTGFENPFTKGAEKVKEKIYERQAYGGGAGGNTGGGSVPPTGGTGAENTINFENVGGGRTGTLGNLLGKAKGAGLIGAGLLGGMMLGGGGGGGTPAGDLSSMSYDATAGAGGEPEVDPYSSLTIGGYSYDQLENGYVNALQAGDADAAKLIGNMISMLEDKIDRYNKAKEKDTSGIASKQRSAMNVLSGLMSNYQAQGPVGGRFTQFMNAITGGGYNPTVAAYDSGSAGSLGTIIKALGDTGALSEGDQKRALELLPKTTDSEEAARYKYQQLMQILQGAGAQ